jgi:glycosyltransferase involved in cell wall biosynthesis
MDRLVVVGVAACGALPVPPTVQRFLRLHTQAEAGTTVEVRPLRAAGGAALAELLTETADVYVLLERGALVGPGWLSPLLAALSVTGTGLAGPSTNRAWNEQAVVRRARADLTSVRRDAAALADRTETISLAPLHSLGDFCFAVRRDVVDAIGGPEPAYGEGPCWEMDYSVRAARAGFAGVWVAGSYVFRPPVPPAERRREERLLERNRMLFQDRLCGLRLRGETDDYRDHCRGDACEHFAPADLLPPPVPVVAAPAVDRAPTTTRGREPLVSCLMVTRGRPEYAAQAVRLFLRQDYPNRELVVVEDGTPALAALVAADPRIRIHAATGRQRSIGALRNQSAHLARGEVLVLWDDDDWHGPGRLSAQVEPILAGRADVTGLTDVTWLEIGPWRSWRLTPSLARRMLLEEIYCGTLAAHRRVWRRGARFGPGSIAEDAAFLRQALHRGARLEPVPGADHFVYVRHATNTWQLQPGRSTSPRGWRAVPEPDLPADDRAFLRAAARSEPAGLPLVSCLMPTRDRERFVPQAVDYFLRQSYPARELVVLDDGRTPIGHLLPDLPAVRYHRIERPMVLGTKRNLAVELAQGSVLAHWDDDDWYAVDRLRHQVDRLRETGASVCGAATLPFYDPVRRRAWRYTWPAGRRPWLAGTSLMFERELWQRHRFGDLPTGEDTRFVWGVPARSVTAVAEPDVVALVHDTNTVAKRGQGTHWSAIAAGEVEDQLGADLGFYRSLTSPTTPVATATA